MRKLILLVLVTCLTIGMGTGNCESKSSNTYSNQYAHVLWIRHYETLEDLFYDSDIVIVGNVVEQKSELRVDMVFTKSTVEIQRVLYGEYDQEYCEVVQTGGVYLDYCTPQIEGVETLTVGDGYIFMLQRSSEDDPYGDYFIISGSNQGVFSSDGVADEITERVDFWNYLEEQFAFTESMAEINSGDPVSNNLQYWNVHTIYYYYENVMYPSYIYPAFIAWNGNQGGIAYSPSNDPQAPVTVMDNNYGSTTWVGITYPYPNGGYNLTYVDIRINKYFFVGTNPQYSALDYKRVICHEAGHGLGYFMHNDVSGSIMRTSLDDVKADGTTGPSSLDIQAITNMYYSYFY